MAPIGNVRSLSFSHATGLPPSNAPASASTSASALASASAWASASPSAVNCSPSNSNSAARICQRRAASGRFAGTLLPDTSSLLQRRRHAPCNSLTHQRQGRETQSLTRPGTTTRSTSGAGESTSAQALMHTRLVTTSPEGGSRPNTPLPSDRQLTALRSCRRALLLSSLGLIATSAFQEALGPASSQAVAAVGPVPPAIIDPSAQPSAAFDPSDALLRRAAEVFQAALEADSVEQEEAQWSQVIAIAEGAEEGAPWVNDILSRAYGNRGNARSRQGKLEQAIEDYNRAIALAPYAADPVLNRGVALESLRLFDEAAADYKAVLAADPRDPAAWNNLGNIMAAKGEWGEAAADYKRASELAPEFSFATANLALALYQLGEDNRAIKQMRTLLRRYPEFPDMRAALAVSLYSAGLVAEAETNWTRLEDLRYRNISWVADVRRWPPRLVKDLQRFLSVTSS